MSAGKVDVLAAGDAPGWKSYRAGHPHTHGPWSVIAGADPKDKGIFAEGWGHYGRTLAVVSNRHEYAHMPEYGAKLAAADAERICACVNALDGIADPVAYSAAVADLIEAAGLSVDCRNDRWMVIRPDGSRRSQFTYTRSEAAEGERQRYVDIALARIGGAP